MQPTISPSHLRTYATRPSSARVVELVETTVDSSLSRSWLRAIRPRRTTDAFEAFYLEHLPWVRRFVARRVDDLHAAADLTADIFWPSSTVPADTERSTACRVHGLPGCLAVLPESQRAVVELVAVDGLTVAEAAQALGITAGNARVRCHRARATLRNALPSPFEVTT